MMGMEEGEHLLHRQQEERVRLRVSFSYSYSSRVNLNFSKFENYRLCIVIGFEIILD